MCNAILFLFRYSALLLELFSSISLSRITTSSRTLFFQLIADTLDRLRDRHLCSSSRVPLHALRNSKTKYCTTYFALGLDGAITTFASI